MTVTDPVTGVVSYPPAANVPIANITGAAFAHIVGTPCSNSAIDCDPSGTVVEVTILDANGNVLNVTNTMISILVPISPSNATNATNASNLVCAYYNATLQVLVTAGLTTTLNANGTVTCTSTHLTQFTLTT